MEANRTQMLRRMDYLLRQIHVEALHRREEFTEVIYLQHAHTDSPFGVSRDRPVAR